MPGWWRRGNSENCDNLIDLLISEKELRQNHRVQFQFIEMIHPNRLENDSIMAPVAQEADIIELSLEQLEGIQGGRWWFWARLIHSIHSLFAWEAGHGPSTTTETPSESYFVDMSHSGGI